MLGIDGEPIEFEWHIFPGLASLEIRRKIQKDLQEQDIEPEKFEDRIIFMSMFNDIEWTKRRIQINVFQISEQVEKYAKGFSRGHPSALETKSSGMELTVIHLKEDGILPATQMVERFKETGHPVFKTISAVSREILKRKNNRDTIYFNAGASNTELLFRTIHSANQLSVYRALSSWSMIQYLETDCENVFRTSKHWRKNPIYKSLRGCVILPKSLYWNLLQDHCRRR